MRPSHPLLILLICALLAGCATSRPETNTASRLRGDDDSAALAAGAAPAVAARVATDRNLAVDFQRTGVLDQRGPGVWVVDGTPVLVDDTTQIIGDPLEGTWVTIEGRRGPDGVQRAVVIRAGAVLDLTGRLDSIAGELWVIEGITVRVPAAVAAGLAPQPGSYVRVIARRDGPESAILLAVRVTLAQELIVIGQVGAIESTLIIVDDRMFGLTPASPLPGDVIVGSFVRITAQIGPDGSLSVITLSVLPTTLVVDGPLELIDDDDTIVVAGRRLRLSPQVLLRITLVIGQPVRLILSDDGTLVIAIIAVRVIVVAPPPVPTVVVVVPAPQPAPPPAPAPRPSNNDDDDDDDD